MPDKMLSMAALTLMRENAHHPWGFRLAGGLNVGQPLMVQLISDGSIADCRGLRKGDKVLQIGRERTIDMTYEDALETITRCGNRLDLVLLRQQAENGKIENAGKSGHVKAIVHNQYNSPMNLYSNENIADTLVKQAQVLTNGVVVRSQPNNMSSPTLKRSEVYRMVQEENHRGSPTGFGTTSPTNFRKNTPPPPPPKPAVAVRQVSSPNSTNKQFQEQQYQYSPKYQQQEQQYSSRYQHPEHRGQTQPTNTTTSRQISSPTVTRIQPQSEYITEEKRTMTDQAQVQYVTYSTPQAQYSIHPQSHGHGGSTHWTAPPPGAHRKPVWPPPQPNQSIITSTQSVKWGGSSRPSKRFVWPPPKGVFIEEDEDGEVTYNQHPHHQHHNQQQQQQQQRINYQQQQASAGQGGPRSRATPRKPSRLAAQAWEPYMGSQEEYVIHCMRGPSRRLRSAREVYQHASNSTPLPPTYRAPPGTQHVIYE